jgi:RNA-binding motif protein, X-linked 2
MESGKNPKSKASTPSPRLLVNVSGSLILLIHLYIFTDDAGSESSESTAPNIDPDDPMRDYLLKKWREERAKKKGKKSKTKGKHKDETIEERRARKERKKEKRARREAVKSDGLKGVEALLNSLDERRGRDERSSHSKRPQRRSFLTDDRSMSPRGR